jgi:hypothetical protein
MQRAQLETHYFLGVPRYCLRVSQAGENMKRAVEGECCGMGGTITIQTVRRVYAN